MSQNNDMIKSIAEIVGNKNKYNTFNIPNLQRGYVWTEIEWEQLWEDIRRVYNAFMNNKESQEQHFMGCLFLKKNKNTPNFYDIIDGQQRFTTLKILMDYLFDLKKYLGELPKDSEDYIKIKNINTPIQNDIIDKDKSEESEKELYTKVYNYYAAQYNMVANTWNLDLLIQIIQNRFFFMVRELTDNENKNDVFEAINATGKPLQFGDLILNYLCELNHESENPLNDCEIRERWKSICDSVYQNELLETAPVIDASKMEEEEEKEEKADEIEDENEDFDIDDTEEQEDEDLEDNCEAGERKKKKNKENPRKLKKFVNALHCLTLPRTKGMPESIDAFEEIFNRLKISNKNNNNGECEDKLTAEYILSQMNEWLEYYLAYLKPQDYTDKEFYCDELYYLSILGNTSIIPVVMRTLKKYRDSKEDCKNILYGITCCQIIKNVYLERDNTHEMDKKCILADYLYESVHKEKDKYLSYLVNIEKLRNGLNKDLQNLNDQNYTGIGFYKVPYNKKICKFLLVISYNQRNSDSKKKLIEKENEKKIIAGYLVSPDEMDEENNPVYLKLGYNGKTVNELWNIVLRKEGSSSECVTFTDCQEEYRNHNLQRLEKELIAIRDYCGYVLNLTEIDFEEKFFVKFVLKDNLFLKVKGCNCKEEDIKKEEEEEVYFGFKYNKKKNKWYFTTYPEKYFVNNDTIAYYLDGKLVEGENENETGNKKTALLALLNEMQKNVGEDNIRELVYSMTRTHDKDNQEVFEKTSNLIYITKHILEQYEKEKKIEESTRKRWCSYLDGLEEDDITVNINTGVHIITKEVRRIYDQYMEIPNPKEKDRKIGFCIAMRRPEMHYIKGVRKLTQYRNLADKDKYEQMVLDKENMQGNMDYQKTENVKRSKSTYKNLNERYFSANVMKIAEIIQDDHELSVPEYQRNYVWDENNWKALIQSIEKNEELNLGSIILYKKENAFVSIVDGQQRLTTIFTLLNCLEETDVYQISEENKEEEMKEKCKKYMMKYVKEVKDKKGCNSIREIAERVKNIKVYVITINCSDSIYQYRVFSSVNGKGKKLSVEAKVKNYLLKVLDEKKLGEGKAKEEKINKINKIASDKGFIKAYSERREKAHIAESKLYEKFKSYTKDIKSEELLNILDQEQKIYAFLKKGNVTSKKNNEEKKTEPIIKEFWIWLKLYQHLKVDTADALLLDILCKNISDINHLKNLSVDGENIGRIQSTVHFLKQINMIYFLLYVDDQNGNGKKSINSKFPRLVGMDDIRIRMMVKDKVEDKEVDLILDDPELYYNSNIDDLVDHIWNKIKETDLTRTMRVNVSRYLLMILEIWNGMDTDTAFWMLTQKDTKGVTYLAKCDVEHIFPANPDKEYENLDHPEYLYMLENVCLLESKINRSKTLSNGMMVMEKNNKKDEVKSKLGYIKNGKFECEKSKYKESKLGFPNMFYDGDKFKYLDSISSSDTEYFYSKQGAKKRLGEINENIKSQKKFRDMLKSVLPGASEETEK